MDRQTDGQTVEGTVRAGQFEEGGLKRLLLNTGSQMFVEAVRERLGAWGAPALWLVWR